MSHHKRTSRKQQKKLLLPLSGLLALYSMLIGLLGFYMYRYQFLAFWHVNLIVTTLLVLVLLLGLWAALKRNKMLPAFLLVLLASLGIGVLLTVFKSTEDLSKTLNTTASYSEIEMSVWVKADNPVKQITELTSIQVPRQSDGTNIENFLKQIQINEGKDLETEEVVSYQEAYERLQGGTGHAMIMNSAYESLLELTDPDYASKIKKIYSYKLTQNISKQQKVLKDTNVFTIYISGIDTFGSISTVSRSDVNILLSVNLNTHKILLTTTPRDAYVKIPDGGADQYDKLTHAGIYGVETSMKTLENLYDIEISHYVRINFTSFLTLIDLLGGVEVTNDQAFSVGGYDFPVGSITLDSKKALLFVRERYSLAGGDSDRGRNQTKVVAAIINKLATFDSISQYSSVISGLQESVQTNMNLETMMRLVNQQLTSGSRFTVTSQAVTGSGSTGELPSYAMPGASLYMLNLDPASLDAAKQQIAALKEGN